MSTSFLTASFCMAWEWGIMMFRWCDAVMQGRTCCSATKIGAAESFVFGI